MEEKYFPKRIKLKVKLNIFNEKKVDSFLFKTYKETHNKMEEYKAIFKPDAVEFVLVQGMVQIIDKPEELEGTALMPGKTLEDLYLNVPEWANDPELIYGKGFENTLYIAKPDFSKITKLKKL